MGIRNNETVKRWIEAAVILGTDPTARVRCPERGDGFLTVHDEPFTHDPTQIERYLSCEVCGARNVMRVNLPPGDDGRIYGFDTGDNGTTGNDRRVRVFELARNAWVN